MKYYIQKLSHDTYYYKVVDDNTWWTSSDEIPRWDRGRHKFNWSTISKETLKLAHAKEISAAEMFLMML